MSQTYSWLQLEVTNACQLTCAECPHDVMQRPVKAMSDLVFNKVVDTFIKNKRLEVVILNKDGEPLLDKNIRSKLKTIHDNINCHVDLYTNGLLLTEEFINYVGSLKNVTRFVISYHLYNKDGSKNDYSKVTELLTKVLPTKSPKLHINLITHKIKYAKQEELDAWSKFWEPYVASKQLVSAQVNPYINKWAGRIEEGTENPTGCIYGAGNVLFIGNTGNVLICCTDLEEEVSFGNILTDNIDSILSARKKFYENIRAKKIEYPICARCIKG